MVLNLYLVPIRCLTVREARDHTPSHISTSLLESVGPSRFAMSHTEEKHYFWSHAYVPWSVPIAPRLHVVP